MVASMNVYRHEFAAVTRTVRNGVRSVESAEGFARDLLTSNFDQAYRQGLRSVGVVRFGDFDEAFVRASVEAEMPFVSKLFADVKEGTGTIPYGTRTAYYTRGYESMYLAGQVQALPWETDIFWRLGAADHCLDCVSLEAAGPYTKATLPIVPGGGGTQCLFNCACRLEFDLRPARTAELETVAGRESVARRLAGEIPEGLRPPNASELETIRDMWGRVQSNRTAVRFAPKERKGIHVAARKAANDELIAFLDSRKIRWTRTMEDGLFNPPPGQGVGGGFPKGGRTGTTSVGSTEIEGAGVPAIAPEAANEPLPDLGAPEE